MKTSIAVPSSSASSLRAIIYPRIIPAFSAEYEG